MRRAFLTLSFLAACAAACGADPSGGSGGRSGAGGGGAVGGSGTTGGNGGQSGSATTGTGGNTGGTSTGGSSGAAGLDGGGAAGTGATGAGGSSGGNAGAAGSKGGSAGTAGGSGGNGVGGAAGATGGKSGAAGAGGTAGNGGSAGSGGSAGAGGSAGTGGTAGSLDAGGSSGARPDAPSLDVGGDVCIGPGAPNVELGTPTDADPSDDVILDHSYFVLSYNPQKNDPNWVSWHLSSDDIGSTARQDNFASDSLLPAMYYHVKTGDYTGSGYDRGHMSPSAEHTASVMQNSASFLMTNMLPQWHELNAGPWEGLETFERGLAATDKKEVYIISGGIYDAAPTTIGPGIAVPKSCFKIVVVLDGGQGPCDVTLSTPIYAVIMPNEKTTTGTKWGDYTTSIDAVEAATGYDFLSGVAINVQTAIESRVTKAP
jgi:endonuclease G